MAKLMNNSPDKAKNIITIGSILMGIILVIGILGALGFFHRNPYGPETKIDDFNKYVKNVPTDRRDAVFTSLYNTIKLNISPESTPPESGAYIRKDSVTGTYDKETDVHFNSFITDIPELQQSYIIYVSWSPDPQADLGGYSVLVSCPSKEQIIYNDFNCKDILSENKLSDLYNKNPIMELLPIVVSYYENKKLVSYRISYKTLDDDTKIKLIITDYTGGNRERAIQTLKEKGIQNPEQYEIEYTDDSAPKFLTPPSNSND